VVQVAVVVGLGILQAQQSNAAGTATANQGFNGGNGIKTSGLDEGGGGGGAGAVGTNGNVQQVYGGNGGNWCSNFYYRFICNLRWRWWRWC
jgi:hypothetical protein